MENIRTQSAMVKTANLVLKKSAHVEPVAYFHVKRSIETIMAIWNKQAKCNNTKIVSYIDKQLPEILPFDSLKIQHCLDNLVSNAVKFTRDGLIKITACKVNLPDSTPYFALSVQDEGGGMSTDEIGTIFLRKKCEEAKPALRYGVVDMGLPMTKEIIEQMDGKILAKSTPGTGSIFSLILPIDPLMLNSLPAPSREPARGVKPGFSHLNVLIVDDYHLNQLTIKALLHDTVNKVYFASNGYEALETLHSCPVDLILMDIHMPVLDGIETTLQIRESDQAWADVKIIALTADPQYHHAHLCRKIGMDDALAKPIRKVDLLRMFSKHCMTKHLADAC